MPNATSRKLAEPRRTKLRPHVTQNAAPPPSYRADSLQERTRMSQNISIIGNQSPIASDSDTPQVQKHTTEPLAREILTDAPPLLESTLDEAREMSSVPERDIPEDVLSRRNEETGETVAGRVLASALERNDQKAMRDAAQFLEDRSITPQMEGMLDQAKVYASSNPVVDTDATAPLEDVQTHEEVSELTEALAEDPTEETEAPVRDLEVEEEIFNISKNLKEGMFFHESLPLDELKRKEAAVSALIENFSTNQTGDDSAHTVLLAQLVKCQIQLSNSITSGTNLRDRLADLERLKSANYPPNKFLERLTDFALTLQNGRDLTLAVVKNMEKNPQRLSESPNDIGLGIVGKDLELFEKTIVDTMVEQLRLLQEGEPFPLGEKSLRSIVRFSLNAGRLPSTVLDLLHKGLSWTPTAEYKNALVQALDECIAMVETNEGRANAQIRGEALRYVDMVFQGSYPERAEEALALKKLILPEYEQEVELQHECTVASRQLMNILMGGETPLSLSRTSALSRAMQKESSASARSFMLTPDIVDALMKKVDIKNFNYHLAHVALLQKHAAEAGLFPLSEEQKNLMSDVQTWCRVLNLGADVAAYAKKLNLVLDDDARKNRCMHELQQASKHFVQGFQGWTEASEAARFIQKRVRMTESKSAGRRENAIYQSSAEYLARLALDHHIVNLTGLIHAKQRFVKDDDAMTLNGEAVDNAMRKQTASLYQAMFGNEDPNDARARMDEKSRKQRMFLDDVQRFESHADTMQSLASSRNEGVRLHKKIHDDEGHIKAMEQDRALIHFTWPHRRIGRLKTCDTILTIAKLAEDMSAATSDKKERLQAEINEQLQKLEGISPFTLASSIRHRKNIPSLDVVLEHMLPRARALNFFEKKITVDGVTTTEAEHTLQKIKEQREHLQVLQQNITRSMDNLRAQLGTENILRLQQTITAGLYKVFAESQLPLSTFTINDAQTRQAVYNQLKDWGLPVHAILTRQLVELTLAALTSPDGTLREDMLRREAERTELDFAGKASAEAMKSNLREQGKSRYSAWSQTRDFINEKLLPDKRRRAEGVRALLREASRPGSGFVYDRSRGMVMDTGAIFLPTTSPQSLVNLVSLAHPLSVRMRLMHSDSITVSNVGNGCYQVMLKGAFAASLGATMKIAVPNTPLTLVPGGNAGGKLEQGLALTFSNEKDCENFLNAFMNPSSQLHRENKSYDPSLWLCASQVRFITGDSVSADASLGLMVSLFGQMLPLKFAASGSSTVALNLAGDISQQVEQNASGETATFSLKGRATLAANFSTGISRGNVYAGSPKTTLATASTIDLEQRFKVVTGPQGIMPSTCAETECMAGPLKRGIMHDVTRALLLPSSVATRLSKDVTFSDAFEKLLRGMPPTARITVHRALKPEVLEESRRLFIEARMATNQDARNAALKKAHELLASLDSYTPTRISIRNVAPADVSRNWSPGLGAFQYARNTSFARINPGEVVSIPLPQDE